MRLHLKAGHLYKISIIVKQKTGWTFPIFSFLKEKLPMHILVAWTTLVARK
jgi:hypothetical protein